VGDLGVPGLTGNSRFVYICQVAFVREAKNTLNRRGNNVMPKTLRESIQPLVVSIAEAAILLGICERTVWRIIAARDIEVVTVGGSKKIRVKEIDRYLDENAIPVKQAS
jgi:excisionase family DNA binding protein